MAAYKNGKLDIRAVPKGSGSYLLQAWAVAIYGPDVAAEYAFGTALKKVGLILGQRTERPPADPGGDRMRPGTSQGGPATFMNYVDTPTKKLGSQEIAARAREAAGQVIEELGKAGFHPIEDRTGAGLIALGNILNTACQMAQLRPQAPEPAAHKIAAEGKTTIKRRFVLEAEPNMELEGPPAQQIGNRLRAQMAKALANIAKDMMHGQAERTIPMLKGSARTAISVKFEGVNDEDGLPVAYLRASVPSVKRGMNGRAEYVPFALVKIFHNVDNQTVTRSPGKVAFADIVFQPTRGQDLAQAFTKWVEAWVPIHHTSAEADAEHRELDQGDPVRGARRPARAYKQFERLEEPVIDLRQYGFTGNDPLLARLMLSPVQQRNPAFVQDDLKAYRVFSLHRTMPEGTVPADALRNIEEEVLIAGTVAVENSGRFFTVCGLLFGDQFRKRETKITYALVAAIVQASSTGKIEIPRRFNKPLEYPNVAKALSDDERRLWQSYGTDQENLQNRTAQQQQADQAQQAVNDEVTRRLMVDTDMTDWFPDAGRRRTVINVAIEEALANPSRTDITKPDRLFVRAKNIAETRRRNDEDDEEEEDD